MDSIPFSQMQKDDGFTSLPDTELVALCQAKEDGAFTELVNRHRASAMKIALSILRDRQEAEDEVQNAFWKAYEHIGGFQGRG